MISIKSALLAVAFVVASLQGSTGYKVETRYPVPGNGGFDYLSIDSAARRLYLSHGTEVNVVDADNGKLIGTIADTPGVHGIAIASEFKHGFTSNGRENKVSMFDSGTLALIKKIDVGKGPDGIYYDPESKRVFTNNHGSEPPRSRCQMNHWTEQRGTLPLPQREIVGMGFDAPCPDLVLGGLPRRRYLVNGFQCDGHFVGFGKRRVSDPPFVEMDGIHLM